MGTARDVSSDGGFEFEERENRSVWRARKKIGAEFAEESILTWPLSKIVGNLATKPPPAAN